MSDVTKCAICRAVATRVISTAGLRATNQTAYCDAHAAEVLARALRYPTTPPAPDTEATR